MLLGVSVSLVKALVMKARVLKPRGTLGRCGRKGESRTPARPPFPPPRRHFLRARRVALRPPDMRSVPVGGHAWARARPLRPAPKSKSVSERNRRGAVHNFAWSIWLLRCCRQRDVLHGPAALPAAEARRPFPRSQHRPRAHHVISLYQANRWRVRTHGAAARAPRGREWRRHRGYRAEERAAGNRGTGPPQLRRRHHAHRVPPATHCRVRREGERVRAENRRRSASRVGARATFPPPAEAATRGAARESHARARE